MNTYTNNQGDTVELLEKTATNKYGNKLLWVRCVNGAVVSIFEKQFNNEFTKNEAI